MEDTFMKKIVFIVVGLLVLASFIGCSTGPTLKDSEFAKKETVYKNNQEFYDEVGAAYKSVKESSASKWDRFMKSDFMTHDRLFATNEHCFYSWWGYKNTTQKDADLSAKQGWWGKPIPFPSK